MRHFFLLPGLLFLALNVQAEPRSRLPQQMTPIEAVNVAVPMTVVVGTVTVRVRGAVVSPPDVNYSFLPVFPMSNGNLFSLEPGIFRVNIPSVPTDVPRALTIRAIYNDTESRDGVIIRRGRTYSGQIRLNVPPGEKFDIGNVLLDLN